MDAPVVALDQGMAFALCPFCEEIHKNLLVPGTSGTYKCSYLLGEYRIGKPFDFKGAILAMKKRDAELERNRERKRRSRENTGQQN